MYYEDVFTKMFEILSFISVLWHLAFPFTIRIACDPV